MVMVSAAIDARREIIFSHEKNWNAFVLVRASRLLTS